MQNMLETSRRRILALWFPRLAAERHLRRARGTITAPLAVVRESGNLQTLCSLSEDASTAGLHEGQPLRDALAMCPELLTIRETAPADRAFLGHLQRWAGKLSPWVATSGAAGLFVDLTGSAHLFGGEPGVADLVESDCARFGLSVHIGVADTAGAAWALARYVGQGTQSARSGDAIDQEAYATRSRAAKRRHWVKGGAAPKVVALGTHQARIAPPGQTRRAIATLPVAALRLPDDMVTELGRVGLRRVEDVLNQPRAPLVRRYGQELGLRIDQALGVLSEPISPARPPQVFACRMTLPEPIGLESDVTAAVDRMLPTLARRLADAGRGARRLRLEAHRADGTAQMVEMGLARPSALPDRMRPLLTMKIAEIDAGFGIDMLRLSAPVHEPVRPEQHRRLPGDTAPEAANDIDDLLGRLGARIGLDQITRRHPGSSHIPEKAAQTLHAAFSQPAMDWPQDHPPRPLTLFPVELVDAPETPQVPLSFKWRSRRFTTQAARGPERIAPEWWLDERPWRTGTRDYWHITTNEGPRLWLYFAHGGAQTGGWFCHGEFA